MPGFLLKYQQSKLQLAPHPLLSLRFISIAELENDELGARQGKEQVR
jgi:hypothetical protein